MFIWCINMNDSNKRGLTCGQQSVHFTYCINGEINKIVKCPEVLLGVLILATNM